jgi:hypothetical protein
MAQNGDHAWASKQTTDIEEIRKWAEARGGKPARVKGTEDSDGGGLLRIDFQEGADGKDDRLEEISWEEFDKQMKEKNLVFLYQDETSTGDESRFFKLVSEETAKDS